MHSFSSHMMPDPSESGHGKIRDPSPQVREPQKAVPAKVDLLQQGTRAIRFFESASAQDMHMCTLQLAHDCKHVLIIADGADNNVEERSVDLAEVSRVAPSNLDEYSVALLLPANSEILEFIFGSEDDWRNWLDVLQELCVEGDMKSPTRVSTPDTAPSEVGLNNAVPSGGRLEYHETICELIELVSELRTQNTILLHSREGCEQKVHALAHKLEVTNVVLKSLIEDNLRLRSILSSRESAIADLATILVSKMQDEQPCTRRASLSSVETQLRPHDICNSD